MAARKFQVFFSIGRRARSETALFRPVDRVERTWAIDRPIG
jgi:hypothetical protein